MNTAMPHKPSTAFIAASWVALLLGAAYLIGLFNATMALNEKGYYLTLLLFGLFAAVSLQKSVRDRVEGIAEWPVLRAVLVRVAVGADAAAGWPVECHAGTEREGLLRHGVCTVAVRRGGRAEEHPRPDRRRWWREQAQRDRRRLPEQE